MSKRSRFNPKPEPVAPEARALPTTIELVDVKALAPKALGPVPAPPADELGRLAVGDYAKVWDGPTGERFWCKIAHVEPHSGALRFEGTVASKLLRLGIAFGARVAFEDRHVHQIKPHG
jgi:hypothetical protein